MRFNKTTFTTTLLLVLLSINSSILGQCEIENKFFKAGESLEYDLHFKWGLISKKSGVATLKTTDIKFNGKNAYRMSLVSHSQGVARKAFELDDTLSCILSPQLVPLAYYKDAHEDGDYTKERITYSYPGGTAVNVKTTRHKNNKFRFDENIQLNNCTYDMMSIVIYARTLDYNNMKKGDRVNVNFIAGREKVSMQIVHDGYEDMKVGSNKFNCIKLSLKIADKAFEEAMKVYISNDLNRMPIRIDSKLKIGNARVMLKRYSGNLHPVNKN